MKLATKNLSKNNRHKSNIEVIIGGPLGILAWSASAGTMLIIFIWGLEKSILAVVVVKAVSWGMWGIGAIREASHLNALKDQFHRVKEARKSRLSRSWGFIFYLRSMGEWEQPKYSQLPVRLTLYYEYFVPRENISPSSPVVCIDLWPDKKSRDYRFFMHTEITAPDSFADSFPKRGLLEWEKVNISAEILDFSEVNPKTVFLSLNAGILN